MARLDQPQSGHDAVKARDALVASVFVRHSLRPAHVLSHDGSEYVWVWRADGHDGIGGACLPGDWFALLPSPLKAESADTAFKAAVDAFWLLPSERRFALAFRV